MKVRRQLAELEPLVLQPLHGVKDDDWHRSPAGKWSLAQIVGHLAMSVDTSASAFEKRADRTGMVRRATPGQAIARHLLLGLGKFPVSVEAPPATRPPDQPEPSLVSAQFRIGVERFTGFSEHWPEDRQLEIFVSHPVLGDLNLPEWIRFHFVHSRHHAAQIRDRVRWLNRAH